MSFMNYTKFNNIKQQTLRISNENLKPNPNKSSIIIVDENREFGKDLTNVSNLTFQNKENVNPNAFRRASDGQKDITNKINIVTRHTRATTHYTGKEEITQKIKISKASKNVNIKAMHDAMPNTKKEVPQNLSVSTSLTIEQKASIVLNPPLPTIPNVIVNNDIITGECLNQKNGMEVDCEMKIVNEGENDINSPVNYASTPMLNPRPQECEEYINDIFQHLKEIEFNNLPSHNYMKSQTDINEKMRGILIDWLVEVHLKFKLLPETLFLTVNIIDRYLEKKTIMRSKLQLVGVTAMLVACKYEEIYAPEVRDFVYITDKAYSKEEILSMESDILGTLNYSLTVPSSFRYLEIYNMYLPIDECAFTFARYLIELWLVEYKMLKYNPSLIAASSLFITLKITKKLQVDKIVSLTGYSEEKLRECSKEICTILENVEKAQLQGVRKKFSMPKFLEVAKIKFN